MFHGLALLSATGTLSLAQKEISEYITLCSISKEHSRTDNIQRYHDN
jgi:hypothetical protein